MHFGSDITLQEIIEKIEAVTVGDILELADELINPSKMTYTLLGPVDGEKDALKKILPSYP
jgi:predicted Zn-dependent peptidase